MDSNRCIKVHIKSMNCLYKYLHLIYDDDLSLGLSSFLNMPNTLLLNEDFGVVVVYYLSNDVSEALNLVLVY